MNLIHREIQRPGSVSSLAWLLAALVLLILALAGSTNKSSALDSIYMAQIDVSNAKWDHIVGLTNPSPEIDSNWSTSDDFNPIQRFSLWNNCEGDDEGDGFDSNVCGKAKKPLNVRYYMAKQINPYVSNYDVGENDLDLPSGTEIKRGVSGVANAFLIMSCIFIGVAFFLQLFDVPYYQLQNLNALIVLFISNVVSHAVTRRMVHSFNDNYNTIGVRAGFGNKYFGMIWAAFGLLIGGAVLELSLREYCKNKSGKKNQLSETQDSEATIENDWSSSEQKSNFTEPKVPPPVHEAGSVPRH